MNMEWRSDYSIQVENNPGSGSLSVQQTAPPVSSTGIYNHFTATADGANVVKVVPRFLFGLPVDVIENLYGHDVAEYPIVGVFTNTPGFDRVIIQAYMNVVVLSVIFLLYANNPPQAVMTKKTN